MAALLACSLVPAHAQEAPAADADTAPLDAMYGPEAAVIDVTRRVIGGNESRRGQFPSIVALLDAGLFSPADRQFCGGTVVAPTWVLTAAHCMFDSRGRRLEVSSLRVVENVVDLREDPITEEVVVANAYVHPDYDNAVLEAYNDIALLELATPLSSEAAALFTQDPEDFADQTAVVAGWGATEFVSSQLVEYPDALHHASVPLVSRAACNVPTSYNGVVREGQLCAGFIDGGVDSCLGDSGGPLYTGVNGRVELIGVTSFGRGCAEPNFYGIYTSVASYVDWIGQYLDVRTITPRDGGSVTGAPAGDSGSSDDDDGGFGSSGTALLTLLGVAVWRRRSRRSS